MVTTEKPLLRLTAEDLMTREVVTLREGMGLREAARELSRTHVHGAPVVDARGQCVGVLSVSDLARWALTQADPPAGRPQTCSFQERHRERGGRETTLCTLADGRCHFQAQKQLPDGRTVTACGEPNCVCLEWQMVEMEALPAEDVRHYMTADPVMAVRATPITAVARMMIDGTVQRVVVVDAERRPVGVVSATDLVAALANAGADGAG